MRILKHEFVEYIPSELKDGTVYVSMTFATATHKCFCGCGNEVITPFSPTDWTLIFDGESISLDPSIGNWNFPCQSHYWIRHNRVRWARRWSEKEISAGRAYDKTTKNKYFGDDRSSTEITKAREPKANISSMSIWWRLKKWLS